MPSRRYIPFACLCLLSAGLLLSPFAFASLAAPREGQVAAVFPAHWSRVEVLHAAARADARLVRFGEAPGVAVLELPENGAGAVRAAGAFVVMDPQMAGACARRPVEKVDPRS